MPLLIFCWTRAFNGFFDGSDGKHSRQEAILRVFVGMFALSLVTIPALKRDGLTTAIFLGNVHVTKGEINEEVSTTCKSSNITTHQNHFRLWDYNVLNAGAKVEKAMKELLPTRE